MEPSYLDPEDDDLSHEQGNPVYVHTRVEIKWWAMVVSVGASLLSAALAIVLVLAVRAESHRTACALIVAYDEGYRQVPPSTPTGKVQAKKISELRDSQGCLPPREGK